MTRIKQAIGAGAAMLALVAAKTCSKVGMIASHGGGAVAVEDIARGVGTTGLHGIEYYLLSARMLEPREGDAPSRFSRAWIWPAMVLSMLPLAAFGFRDLYASELIGTLMLVGLMALQIRAARTAHPLDVAHVVENREAGRSIDVFVSLPQLARAFGRRPPDPVALITAGIVLLLATPGAALVVALIAFLRGRDRTYAVICAALLAALVCGFALNVG